MTLKQRDAVCLKSFLWAIFIIFIIFSSALPGIEIPGVGYLYPFRICLPLIVLYYLFNNRYKTNYTNVYTDTWIMFVFMFIYGCFTLIWTIDTSNSIKMLMNYLYGFLLVFAVARMIRDKKILYQVVIISAVILMATMVWGIFEAFTGKHFLDPEWDGLYSYYDKKIQFPVVCFGNPNDMVFIIIGFMPLVNMAVRNIIYPKNKLIAILFLSVYVVLYLLVTYLASCRMGILLFGVVILVSLFFREKKIFKQIGILCLVAGFIVFILKFDLIFESFLEESRIPIWKNILKNAQYFYFMGTGPGNSYIEISGVTYEGELMNPHFWFLEIFAEFGIWVLILFIIWYALSAKRAFRGFLFAKTKEDRSIGEACAKFFIYFIFMSVMSSSISAMPGFWFILGLVLCSINILYQND